MTDNVLILCVILLSVITWGKPDLIDATVSWLTKPEQCTQGVTP